MTQATESSSEVMDGQSTKTNAMLIGVSVAFLVLVTPISVTHTVTVIKGYNIFQARYYYRYRNMKTKELGPCEKKTHKKTKTQKIPHNFKTIVSVLYPLIAIYFIVFTAYGNDFTSPIPCSLVIQIYTGIPYVTILHVCITCPFTRVTSCLS